MVLHLAEQLGLVVGRLRELEEEGRVLAQAAAVPPGHAQHRRGGAAVAFLVTPLGAGQLVARLVERVGQLAELLRRLGELSRLGRDAERLRPGRCGELRALRGHGLAHLDPRPPDGDAVLMHVFPGGTPCKPPATGHWGEGWHSHPRGVSEEAMTDAEQMGREAEQSDWLDHAVRAGWWPTAWSTS